MDNEKVLLSVKYWVNHDAKLEIFQQFVDDISVGDSFLKLNNLSEKSIKKEAFDITTHEMAHRFQTIMPEIQNPSLYASALADWLQGLAERCSDSVAVPSEDLNI